jgi:hypothetical protein
VECHAKAELDAGHLEEVVPHVTGEDGVTVVDDGCGEAMWANNAVEEGTGDRGSRVWVTDGDEVCIPGEAVDNGEDHGLPVNLWLRLDEVHRDVSRHLGGHVEGLKKSGRLRGWCLVALARGTRTDVVLDERPVARDVEVQSVGSR